MWLIFYIMPLCIAQFQQQTYSFEWHGIDNVYLNLNAKNDMLKIYIFLNFYIIASYFQLETYTYAYNTVLKYT